MIEPVFQYLSGSNETTIQMLVRFTISLFVLLMCLYAAVNLDGVPGVFIGITAGFSAFFSLSRGIRLMTPSTVHVPNPTDSGKNEDS